MVWCVYKMVKLNPLLADLSTCSFTVENVICCVCYGALSVDYLTVNFHSSSIFATRSVYTCSAHASDIQDVC